MTARVVYLTYVFPPNEAPRAVQVGRLVAHSALDDLHVVCAAEAAKGDRVHVVPWSAAARGWRGLRWSTLRGRMLVPDAFRPWARAAGTAARRLNPAVLVTFGQPMSDHLAGLRVRRRTGIRWIAHFSDPWTDNPFRGGGVVSRAANRRLESAVLRTADALVFTSSETADLVLARQPSHLHDKAQVIPHALDREAYPTTAGGVPDGPFVIRHLGAFYGARTAAPLLRAVTALARKDPALLTDVRIELWGPTETSVESLAEFGSLPAGLVTVHDSVPYARSLKLMRTADLLVVLDAPAALSVFLPSKLVDYLGARRPILALTPLGPADALVRRAGGWVAAPDDTEAAAKALRDALKAARASRGSDWGAPEVVAEYDAPAVTARMDELVQTVAAGGA